MNGVDVGVLFDVRSVTVGWIRVGAILAVVISSFEFTVFLDSFKCFNIGML